MGTAFSTLNTQNIFKSRIELLSKTQCCRGDHVSSCWPVEERNGSFPVDGNRHAIKFIRTRILHAFFSYRSSFATAEVAFYPMTILWFKTLNLEMLILERWGEQEKNLSEQSKEPVTNLAHILPEWRHQKSGIEPRPHRWGGGGASANTTALSLVLIEKKNWHEIDLFSFVFCILFLQLSQCASVIFFQLSQYCLNAQT